VSQSSFIFFRMLVLVLVECCVCGKGAASEADLVGAHPQCIYVRASPPSSFLRSGWLCSASKPCDKTNCSLVRSANRYGDAGVQLVTGEGKLTIFLWGILQVRYPALLAFARVAAG
jgi:hypothetical protein